MAVNVLHHVINKLSFIGNPMQNIIRDLKRHTSESLHKAIQKNNIESRREWIIWMMERAGKKIAITQTFSYGSNIISQLSLSIINSTSKIGLHALQSC
jgi:hypothetical protein